MGYFSAFPLVNYNNIYQVNLTRRVGIIESFKSNAAFYYEYSINDADTPESIADKLYDDPELAWVVLQFNNIINVFEEWPKPQYELDSYVNEKYENPYAVHHYVDLDGNEVDFAVTPSWNRMPVTNYEYETLVNDNKRKIKLVLPELVNTIVNRHKELIQEGV